MTEYSFEGVQLLPNHPFSYIQRTYAKEGIEIEEWAVLAKDLCGNTLEDLTEYFDIVRVFDDEDTGLPQVEWSLKEIPFDFGFRNIYLQIQVGADAFIYSSPFYLTDYRKDWVSRWDYRNDDEETMLSTSLRFYFRQPKSQQEISNYTQVSTGNTFTATSKLTKYERWNTEVIEINFIEKIKEMFLFREVYSMGLNDDYPVRTGLFEAIESPDLEMDENFVEQEINLLRNYTQLYDPNYIPPIPPDPPVDPPAINLRKVTSEFKGYVTYEFGLVNFSPTYLTFQYSPDGVNWSNNTGDPTSPHNLFIGNTNVTSFYFRIIHESGVTSNVVQMVQPSIVINNITSPQSAFDPQGNSYNIFYTITGFTPTADFVFQGRPNNTQPWSYLNYSSGNQNPKQVFASTAVEFTEFRIVYNPLGLASNTKTFQFPT